MPTGRERVRADAESRGIAVELVERAPASSLVEAAAAAGLAPHQVVKTLVVKRHDGGHLLALVPGDRQISWAKLRALVGVNKLRLADTDGARDVTGYERGTITPLGATGDLPVYADATISGRISLGGGEHGVNAMVDAAELLAAFDAVVADIGEPYDPR